MTIDAAGLRPVTEVIGASRGSGYMIARGRILTALHVVLGNDPPDSIPDGAGADVRMFGDIIDAIPRRELGWNHAANQAALAAMNLPWHRAKLIWPRAGTSSRATDIALLELADPHATAIGAPAALRIPTKQREDQCFAGGFPSFRAEDPVAATIWEFYQFKGELNPAPRRGDGARYVDVASMVLPSKVEGWRGMSGAALWLDNGDGCTALLGVMHALVERLELNNQLLYWPLDSIDPRDPDFWRLTGLTPPGPAPAKSVAAIAAAKPLVAQLADNFFRFDRANFSEVFREWLCGDPPPENNVDPRFHRQGLPSKPAVIVLRGHRVDEPQTCAQRFADILAVEAWPGSAALYRTPVHLDCGPHALPYQKRLRTLLRQWAQAYSDELLPLDADVSAIIQNGLADRGRARCILIEHSQAVFDDGCRDVIAGALGPLRKWKLDPNAPATPPVLLLSILTGQDGGPPESAFYPPTPFDGKAARIDAALSALIKDAQEIEWFDLGADLGAELARPQNVPEWLNQIKKIEAAATLPAGIGAEIEMMLRPHVQFPIAFARVAVDSVIKERRS